MKRLPRAFIAMSIMLAARPAVADAKAGYHCHTPGAADAGYVVRIEIDDSGTARVFVSADSIAGPRPLGSYAVNVRRSGPVTVFQGGGLTLTMREPEWWQRVADANFTAMTDRSVVKGDLGCRPP